MTGYKFKFHGKKDIEMTPCLFCKHRGNMTVESPCYNCIDNVDLALHKPNSETEFANFEPLTEAHGAVVDYEIKEMKRRENEN